VCDTVAVATATGTWFAKNSDRSPHELQVVEATPGRSGGGDLRTQYLTLPDAGASAILGCRPTWLRGLEMGVNEYGVAIGNEKVWTTDPIHRAPAALLGMDLVRLALERGTDADTALAALTAALEAHGQGGNGEFDHHEPYTSSFLIADAQGGWHVETRGRSWAAGPIEGGLALSNRVSMRTGWTRASSDVGPGTDVDTWRLPTADVRIADGRLAVTHRALDDPDGLDEHRLFALLRDHAGTADRPGGGSITPVPSDPGPGFEHLSVCMHLAGVSVTTASMVAHLPRDPGARPRIWCAIGSPCASVYVPIDPSAPPALLADPAVAARFHRLRDRVEADAAGLDAVRAVLDPLEADLLGSGPDRDPTSAIESALGALGL
jgi:secernin